MSDVTEVSCATCVAACCKAPVNMTLTAEEHKRHSRTMDLEIVLKPRDYPQRVPVERSNGKDRASLQVPAGFGLYELVSGCANLTPDNLCSIYPERPKCCRDFAAGSAACLKARREAGLDADLPIGDDEHEPAEGTVQRLLADLVGDDEHTAPSATTAARGAAPLDLDEARALVAQVGRWTLQRLAQAEPSDWSRNTRCPDWDVAALAVHLVMVQQFAHEMLSAGAQRRPATAPPDFAGDRDETLAALARAVDDLDTVFGRLPAAAIEREVVIGNEAVGLEHVVQALAMEVAVHSLDLADALGDDRHLSPAAVRAISSALPDLLDSGRPPHHTTAFVLRSVAFEMHFHWAGDAWQPGPGRNPVWIEGDVEDVLLYALGREPFDHLELRSNRADRARAFKRHLVGP